MSSGATRARSDSSPRCHPHGEASGSPGDAPTDPDEAERADWLTWRDVRSELEAGGVGDGLPLTGLLRRLAFRDT